MVELSNIIFAGVVLDIVKVPSEFIVHMPVKFHVAEISQSEEFMIIVSPLSPRVIGPFASNVPLIVSVPAKVALPPVELVVGTVPAVPADPVSVNVTVE